MTGTMKGALKKKLTNKHHLLISLALVFTVALIACGSSASPSNEGGSANPTNTNVSDNSSASNTSSSTNAFNDGSATNSEDLAPDFSIVMFQGQDLVGGQEINFSELIGHKPVVLNFWAGLCPPCRAEMPDLQTFSEKFEDEVVMLGIDIGQFLGLGSQEDAKDLLAELGVTYPAGFTNDISVIQEYKVLGMPTTVFIDAQGEIFNRWTGALNGAVLEEKTLEMLNQ